jgi:hypothetical protein
MVCRSAAVITSPAERFRFAATICAGSATWAVTVCWEMPSARCTRTKNVCWPVQGWLPPLISRPPRYVVSDATNAEALLVRLHEELRLLAGAEPARVETTLLIHPSVLTDFDDFNDFLGAADAALESLGYVGVLQVASFHPQYRFAGTAIDDVTNATNRSPYPTLHLLREESIDRAVAAFPDASAIYKRNIRTLQAFGPQRWAVLQAACRSDADYVKKRNR